MNDFKPLIYQLTTALQAKNMTIATAESCTGGLIASLLTQLPGSSAWFERGFVAYSNLAKQQMLGIDKSLIIDNGAVSAAVAKAMAKGAITYSNATIALSVTGIAGPTGGSDVKPVGSVYFGFATSLGDLSYDYHQFDNTNRQDIRLQACGYVLQKTLSIIAQMII